MKREQQLRAYVDYLRDMGVHDFYRQGEPVLVEAECEPHGCGRSGCAEATVVDRPVVATVAEMPENDAVPSRPAFLEPPIAKLVSFDDLAPLPESTGGRCAQG